MGIESPKNKEAIFELHKKIYSDLFYDYPKMDSSPDFLSLQILL